MKKSTLVLTALIIGSLALGSSFAQPKPTAAPAERGNRGPGNWSYDTAKEITVKAEVVEVKSMEPRNPQANSGKRVQLVVKVDKAEKIVMVGPESILEKEKFSFAKGDKLTITGITTNFREQDGIMARTIKKGKQTLELRNADGTSKFGGRGPGQGNRGNTSETAPKNDK
jgi:DNA/RNA endonuclease YhcR with UshA esterase domain